MSADDAPDLDEALAQFQRDLAALRAKLDLSFADMERRLRQLDLPDVRGSDTTFSNLLQRPMKRPPRKATLRGFLVAVGVDTPAELAFWEGRRLDLAQRCARGIRTSTTSGDSTGVSTARVVELGEDTAEDEEEGAETGAGDTTPKEGPHREPDAEREGTATLQTEPAGERQEDLGEALSSPAPPSRGRHRVPSLGVLVVLSVSLVIIGVGIALPI